MKFDILKNAKWTRRNTATSSFGRLWNTLFYDEGHDVRLEDGRKLIISKYGQIKVDLDDPCTVQHYRDLLTNGVCAKDFFKTVKQ